MGLCLQLFRGPTTPLSRIHNIESPSLLPFANQHNTTQHPPSRRLPLFLFLSSFPASLALSPWTLALPPALAATAEPPATDPAPAPSPSPAKRKPDAEATDLAPLDPPPKSARPDADEAAAEEAARARAADKGKGKMVVEDEDEEEEEGGGSDEDSSDDDDDDDEEGGGGGGGGGGDDSDDGFCDDPLAEGDLNNILPSRPRRRAPPQPGACLVPPEEAAEDDDDEDADVDVDVDMARGHQAGDGEDSD